MPLSEHNYRMKWKKFLSRVVAESLLNCLRELQKWLIVVNETMKNMYKKRNYNWAQSGNRSVEEFKLVSLERAVGIIFQKQQASGNGKNVFILLQVFLGNLVSNDSCFTSNTRRSFQSLLDLNWNKISLIPILKSTNIHPSYCLLSPFINLPLLSIYLVKLVLVGSYIQH